MEHRAPMKLAIIGIGGYAGYLIDRIAELPDTCQLVAFTSRDLNRDAAQQLVQQGVKGFRDAAAMLDALSPADCPAVIIPTGIDSHLDYAELAVKRGFHVLLEKPPVATVQDLSRLITLQRESGRWIAVNFQHLYSPVTRTIKQRLTQGEFGAISGVSAWTVWRRPESYFSRSDWSGKLRRGDHWILDGTIGNPLAHMLAEALCLATAGPGLARPIQLESELYRVNDIESEDTSCLRLITDEQVPVSFCASLCAAEEQPVVCEVQTERARLRLVDYQRLEIHWNDGRVEDNGVEEHNVHADRKSMLSSICKSLRNGERPLVTVEECRPYMLVWNGAFDAHGVPRRIDEYHIEAVETEAGVVRTIPGLYDVMEQVAVGHRMLSEVDVAWAREGGRLNLMDYRFFPSCQFALRPFINETVGAAGA